MLVFILLRFQQAYETLQARHGFFDHEVASEIARELQIEIKVETLITRAFFPRYHRLRKPLVSRESYYRSSSANSKVKTALFYDSERSDWKVTCHKTHLNLFTNREKSAFYNIWDPPSPKSYFFT